jgi:hypothetical protein
MQNLVQKTSLVILMLFLVPWSGSALDAQTQELSEISFYVR